MGLFSNFLRNTGREDQISRRMTFFGITPEDMSLLVTEYVAKLETEESAGWCACLWRIHPDDQGSKPGRCRICGGSPKGVAHQGLPEDFESGDAHRFRGIRKTRVDTHPECPVHTKEGLIIGFVKWLADNG